MESSIAKPSGGTTGTGDPGPAGSSVKTDTEKDAQSSSSTHQKSPAKKNKPLSMAEMAAKGKYDPTISVSTEKITHNEGDKFRSYVLKRMPPKGYKKNFLTKFQSMVYCVMNKYFINGYYYPVLCLRFSKNQCAETFEDDYKNSEEIKFDIDGVDTIIKAADTNLLDKEGTFKPRIAKTVTFEEMPNALAERPDLVKEALAKYMSFEDGAKLTKVYENGCFLGKMCLSVKDFKLVPRYQFEFPAVYLSSDKEQYITDDNVKATVEVLVSCQGYHKGDGGIGVEPKIIKCTYPKCRKTGHLIKDCPMMSADKQRKKDAKAAPKLPKKLFYCNKCYRRSNKCTENFCGNLAEIAKGKFTNQRPAMVGFQERPSMRAKRKTNIFTENGNKKASKGNHKRRVHAPQIDKDGFQFVYEGSKRQTKDQVKSVNDMISGARRVVQEYQNEDSFSMDSGELLVKPEEFESFGIDNHGYEGNFPAMDNRYKSSPTMKISQKSLLNDKKKGRRSNKFGTLNIEGNGNVVEVSDNDGVNEMEQESKKSTRSSQK